MHHVVQKIEDIKPGTLIRVSKDNYNLRNFYFSEVVDGIIYGTLHTATITADIKDYEFSYLNSLDFEGDKEYVDGDIWAACEMKYGINHYGSQDPDPLRDLAFKILKGDSQALDAAKDILKL